MKTTIEFIINNTKVKLRVVNSDISTLAQKYNPISARKVLKLDGK